MDKNKQQQKTPNNPGQKTSTTTQKSNPQTSKQNPSNKKPGSNW